MRVASLINRILHRLNVELHDLWFMLISFLENNYLYIIGVKVPHSGFNFSCKFRGWTSVFRADNSLIEIENSCSFNSSGYTNHIGLNHRCIITTMRAGAIIHIGEKSGMSSSTITSWKSVYIGKRCRIGANCVIMDGDFHLDDPRTPEPLPIIIEDDVWLGANVVVLKGVKIGNNSIIGMNSVVTKDIPANSIAVGNPCKVIKSIHINQMSK